MLAALTQHLKLPDLWQHEAVNHLRAGSDVIVSAPTGAGKTYIFELLVQTGSLKRQAVYTVPTRALANDKYAEWKDAGWNVGLATGDLAENVRAPVLVATLETQMERLLLNDGPELLVMDEFQMISDPARGSHYEAALVLAPSNTRLLLLSGSVENSHDVAEWLRRIGRTVEVVSTRERPVPLEEMPIEVPPAKKGTVEGWWPRLVTSVLMNDLAPLLIFAPRRKDAESIANKLSTHLPPGEPLSLTTEQRALAGKDFAALLEKRIAFHHSGLAYGLRAGLIEPLAKAGQLRVIVSTMGLAAGINFSVRSVHVSSTSFHDGLTEQQLSPDELLQMFGRAGRRGLDEMGYVITTRESPALADARPARLRRSSKLSWPIFIRVMRRAALDGRAPFEAAKAFAQRLFAKVPPELGWEEKSGFPLAGEAASALFGLKGTRRELLNSAGQWEEVKVNPAAHISLAEAWRATETYHGHALGDQKFLQGMAEGLGRLFKLTRREGSQLYGKEIALGRWTSESGLLLPTQTLRKHLQIPRHIEQVVEAKLQQVLLPKLWISFPHANFLGLVEKEGLLWAQFDFSPMLMEATQDSLQHWIVTPQLRTVERVMETAIQQSPLETAQSVRGGSPVHAWRELGLIGVDGSPTQRGIIFSFFQHGEGLVIAAALEDESYPVEEMVLHLANLRSDCRLDTDVGDGSERLSVVCRAVYGFVNHHGYLEAGLPLGYGAGTTELLALGGTAESVQPRSLPAFSKSPVAEGDLSRAYIEWLSLLRHITHAPDHDWERWRLLKQEAARSLEKHLASSRSLHAKLPALTPKQKHDHPRHYVLRGRG